MGRKIWIIMQREYLQRVKTKGFVIATLLAPIGMAALMIVPIAIMLFFESDSTRRIKVIDESGLLLPAIEASREYELIAATGEAEALRMELEEGLIDGFLVLPATLIEGEGEAAFYSSGSGGLTFRFELQRAISRAVRQQRMMAAGVPEEVRDLMQQEVQVRMVKVTEAGEAADATAVMTGVGYFMGFVIYICMFIYGSLVMRGVIEEKTSRIVEVIISSVKPFQLMMGKVLGIGAMGLTQFAIWIILGGAIMMFAAPLAMLFLDPAEMGLADAASQEAILDAAGIVIPEIPFLLIVLFVVYFLGGYLLYASIFASIGSAVEQESDAQQLMLPVSLLIIVPIIFINLVAANPDSTLSVVLSHFPFFSPILMVVRLAITEVPLWELLVSLALLGITFMGAVWVGSRIYRVGILMYGKRPSFRELVRWMRYA